MNFISPDTAIEEEEDSVVPKTTRIVIKVPSSKSVNETIVCTEEIGTEVSKQHAESLISQELGNVSNAEDSGESTRNEPEPVDAQQTEIVGESSEIWEENNLSLKSAKEAGTYNKGELVAPTHTQSIKEGDPENLAEDDDTQVPEVDGDVGTGEEHQTESAATGECIAENSTEESQGEQVVETEEVAAALIEVSAKADAVYSVSSKAKVMCLTENKQDAIETLPQNMKSKEIITKLERKQVSLTSTNKSAEKTIEKASNKSLNVSAKTESKSSKPTSNNKNRSAHGKDHTESVKQKQSDSGDTVKHSSKHIQSLPHKQKGQNDKTNVETKTSASVKTLSKTETAAKEDSKGDSSKKHVDGKDRLSHSESTQSIKNAISSKQPPTSSHRTRSNSSTPKESSSRDKRSAHKEEGATKKTTATSRSDDSSSSSKSNSDAKVSLRSSRSRKSHSDVPATNELQEPTPVKKEKAKANLETPQKPRQSERVSKATEKAIASGLISRRSRTATVDNTNNSEKPSDSGSEDQAPTQRRGKRKADSSPPPIQEETPSTKRRVTRSGEGSQPSDSSAHSLRSVRKNKSLKRKGSSGDS